jgi:hypothetical protein
MLTTAEPSYRGHVFFNFYMEHVFLIKKQAARD